MAYFIGNFSAKKYQNPFTCVKVIASQRWGVFEAQRSKHCCVGHNIRCNVASYNLCRLMKMDHDYFDVNRAIA